MRTILAYLAALAFAVGAAAQAPTTITLSPTRATTLDRIQATVTGELDCGILIAAGEPRVEGDRIVLPIQNPRLCDPPLITPFAAEFGFGPLPAGTWTVEAVIDEIQPPAARRTLEVVGVSPILRLHEGSLDGTFEVTAEWSTADGSLRGIAHPVRLSGEAGYFWFFSGTNPEIMVKILNGKPVNGKWWVFISSTTNLRFSVKVRFRLEIDPPFIFEKIYESPAGANKNFIDTQFL